MPRTSWPRKPAKRNILPKAHPASSLLKNGFLINERQGNPRDARRWASLTLSGVTWGSDTAVGPYIRFNGTSGTASVPLDGSTTPTLTLWAVLRFPGTFPADKCLWELSANANSNAGSFACFPGGGLSGNTAAFISAGNGATYETCDFAASLWNDAKWHSVVLSYDRLPTGTDQVALWNDGYRRYQTAEENSSDFTGAFGNYTLYLGARGGASLFCQFDLAMFAVSCRRPSAVEVLRFHRNPFGAPRRRPVRLAYQKPVVTFDSASNSGAQTGVATYSWSHTCSGTNRFLAVDVALFSPGQTVTGITYNGVALSLIIGKSTVTSFGRVECWGLANPASGSNTIQVTLSGSITSAGMAVSYNQVHQTNSTESTSSNQATNVGAADATVDVTPVAGGCMIRTALATNDSDVTAAQTNRNEVNVALVGSGADEDFYQATAATKTMSFTSVDAGQTWAVAGYALRPVTAASNAYSLAIGGGTYTHTGTAAGLAHGYKVPVGLGVYALSGTAVGLKRGYPIAVGLGSYTLTGTPVGLRRGYPIAVGLGTYNLAGSTVGFLRSYVMPVGVGVYTLNGAPVGLAHGYKLGIGVGAYSLNGSSVGLIHKYVMPVSGGVYVVDGSAVVFHKDSPLVIGAGIYTLSGSSVALRHASLVAVSGGSYALSGSDVAFRKGPILSVGGGVYALTGSFVSLRSNHKTNVGVGSYSLLGTGVDLKRQYPLAVGSGLYNLSGVSVRLAHSWSESIAPGIYVLTGSSVTFATAHKLSVGAGTYILTGSLVLLRSTHVLPVSPATYQYTGADIGLHYSEEVSAVGTVRFNVSSRSPSGVFDGRTPTVVVSARSTGSVVEVHQ